MIAVPNARVGSGLELLWSLLGQRCRVGRCRCYGDRRD